MSGVPSTPLGILAGGGKLPLEVANAVLAAGRSVHIVALEGEAEIGIEAFPHTWVNWGGVGAMVGGFRRAGCREIVILGNVRRPNLMKLRPDLGFFMALPGLIKMLKGGDDSVLRRVVGMFEAQGLSVRGVHEVAPVLLAPEGLIADLDVPDGTRAAIALGQRALGVLAPFDLGQAVVAGTGGLLEIEGAEGTDAMLRRLAESAPAEGYAGPLVLVKAPKIGQEVRIDLPAIGPRTIELAAAAGLAGLAIESRSVLIADRAETIAAANRAGLFLCGFEGASGFQAEGGLNGRGVKSSRFCAVGKWRGRAMDSEDALAGSRVQTAIAPYWGDGAVVVSRGYVLAVETLENAKRGIDRARRNKPWGMRMLKRGVGVLVLGAPGAPVSLLKAVRDAGFSAIACAGERWGAGDIAEMILAGDDAGVAVLVAGDGR